MDTLRSLIDIIKKILLVIYKLEYRWDFYSSYNVTRDCDKVDLSNYTVLVDWIIILENFNQLLPNQAWIWEQNKVTKTQRSFHWL